MEEMPTDKENTVIAQTITKAKEYIQNYQYRICYEDTDAGGVVYHAKYLGMAERARSEAIRRIDPNALADLSKKQGMILVVRQVEVQYKKPLFIDDLANIRTSVLTVLGASCWLSQIVSKDDAVVTEIKLQLVCLRKSDYMPAPFPKNWQVLLDRLSDLTE